MLTSAQVSFNFWNDTMHSMAHVRFWIYSCKLLNCEVTFQFKCFKRNRDHFFDILFYSEPWSFTLALCLTPNHCRLLKEIGHTVMIKVINTGLYFYFPQGEDSIFCLIFTSVLCKSNHYEYWKGNIEWEQYVSQTLYKIILEYLLKYALITSVQ